MLKEAPCEFPGVNNKAKDGTEGEQVFVLMTSSV